MLPVTDVYPWRTMSSSAALSTGVAVSTVEIVFVEKLFALKRKEHDNFSVSIEVVNNFVEKTSVALTFSLI
jgi:hypothetical protein